MLTSSFDGRERFLYENCAVETLWRVLADVAIPAVAIVVFAEVVEQNATTANLRFGVFLHAVEFLGVDVTLAAFVYKFAERDDILEIVEQHRFGGEAVAARAPDFLVKALDALGEIVMDYVTDIAFVDAHAECDCRAHDIDIVVDEILLHIVAFFGGQPCMVSLCVNACIEEFFGDFFGALARKAIDDSRFVLVL